MYINYEKKYVQLTEQDIEKVALNYHNWQQADFKTTYQDIPEFRHFQTVWIPY
jgi:type I restriction enzyme M protein